MADSQSSNDSDPVLVNASTASIEPVDNTSQDSEQGRPQAEQTQGSFRPPPLSRASTSSLDKCWICLSTVLEDDPNKPDPWRHPCKCSLAAHESCLLDWVADQENPRNGGRASSDGKILCPQCKSEIKVQRPTNRLVQACQSIDRACGRLVLPCLGLSLVGTVWTGCWAYGHMAVYWVFGRHDAARIAQFALARSHNGYGAAYALIPINLIFARTRYSDFVLPSGTLFLLSTQLENGFEVDWTTWPPQPSTVFACLPAAKHLYNYTYEYFFAALNKRWMAEVLPRREEGYEGQHQNIADILNEQEQQGGGDFVVDLEFQVHEETHEEIHERLHAEAVEAAGHNVDGEAGDADAEGEPHVHIEQNGHVHRILGDNELMDDTSSIGQSVIGALALPIVSAGMGELLKLALPTSWTSPANFYRGRSGLLATKWGRSVVGGALFVVMKDALVLYCRWRLAKGHKMRKIMNFDKKKKEYVTAYP